MLRWEIAEHEMILLSHHIGDEDGNMSGDIGDENGSMSVILVIRMAVMLVMVMTLLITVMMAMRDEVDPVLSLSLSNFSPTGAALFVAPWCATPPVLHSPMQCKPAQCNAMQTCPMQTCSL